MNNLNIEIKARCSDKNFIRNILLTNNARQVGTDHQVLHIFQQFMHWFKVIFGNIEYSLVSYIRSDDTGPKRSDVIYYHPLKNTPLKSILSTALGVMVTVKKSREIFYIDNVKFHLDTVEDLGDFVEIEAIDQDGSLKEPELRKQCNNYLTLFKIDPDDLIKNSYSDQLLDRSKKDI